jgi:ubiquinone/menaquinone biosynthesis C-methylase UbiE/predicted RNA-binding Zn-ribbon protein involved in translation (DUF1610 family)
MPADHPPICDYEGSDYQERFWDAGDRAYEDRVEAIALDRLLPEKGRLLLELGAGAGRNTPRYRGFERVALVDYSRSQLQAAQKRLGRDRRYIYVAADVYRLPFAPGAFDAATMIRVLHHMADPQRALSQVREAMHQNGIFILEYANKRNLKAILRFALRRQAWNPFSLTSVEFAALNYDFHPKSVRNWLAGCGFSVERQLTVSHFRIEGVKRLVPLNLLVRLDALAQVTGDWWQLSPSVFVRSRATGKESTAPSGALFKCPACGNYPLDEPLLSQSGEQVRDAAEALVCNSCGWHWPIEGGIYDFRAN